jgi:hypothetical protein
MREQKALQYRQVLFAGFRYGDGPAKAGGETRGFVDRGYGVGKRTRASVLPEAQRAAASKWDENKSSQEIRAE